MAARRTPKKPAVRRVTVNLPSEMLGRAQAYTGKGITETVVEGLQLLRQQGAVKGLLSMAGKLDLGLDMDELRGRGRH
jgi:hypothetical protein